MSCSSTETMSSLGQEVCLILLCGIIALHSVVCFNIYRYALECCLSEFSEWISEQDVYHLGEAILSFRWSNQLSSAVFILLSPRWFSFHPNYLTDKINLKHREVKDINTKGHSVELNLKFQTNWKYETGGIVAKSLVFFYVKKKQVRIWVPLLTGYF